MIRQYLLLWSMIFLCAFFCCAGIQMIKQDAGILQMEAFRPDQKAFLAVSISRKADEQLLSLANTSGIAYEKLMAAFMLKNQFDPSDTICRAEVISDTLGYERLNENKFEEIVSYYKRISSCVEFLPVCSIYLSENGVKEKKPSCDAGKLVDQMTVVFRETEEKGKTESWQLGIPVEENDQELVPVVCMKTGTVVSRNQSENTICLQLEEGIQIIYGNVKPDLKEWEEGDVIGSGELIGSVSGAEGLLLWFRLRISDGTWASFNGSFCLQHGEKKIRSVIRTLP